MEQSNSLQLTSEQLATIEDMSSCLMSPGEIALYIDCPVDKFNHIINHKKTDQIYIAFHKGRIKTKLELHRIVIKLAHKGSPQAEQLADKYLKEQNTDNL